MDLQGGDTGGLSVFRVSKNRVSSARFETIVRLGGGSDTAQHYIYGGEGNSTGIILDRGSSTISVIGVFETRRDTVNYYRSVNNAASVFTDLQFDVRNVYYQFNAGTGMGLGITSGASARLHVKGDGTNPIALFEGPSSSVFLARINDRITSGGSAGLGLGGFELLNGDNTTTVFRLTRSAEAGLVVQSLANIGFSLGNTFSASAYHVNFTRTGGGHILQTLTGTNVTSSWYTGDGSSNTGWIGTESNHSFGILTNNNYKVLISNNTNTLIALGNSFTSGVPAIKRNGTAIEFKLADDSDYCSIFASSVRSSLMQSFSGANNGRVSLQTWNNMIVNVEDDGVCIQSGAFASPNASAILQVNSTTKGFLPPRMTTTERNAIASPASGLIVYDRTLNKLYLFTTAWEEITSA
jgi:hypothetical protein